MNIYEELQELIQKAKRYDWLIDQHKGDYIWYNVFTDAERDLGNTIEEVIDNSISLQEQTK